MTLIIIEAHNAFGNSFKKSLISKVTVSIRTSVFVITK